MMPSLLPGPPGRILIVKPSALGDIVHSLPFLHAIKRTYPAAKVDWVVARGLHTFLEGHPLIDRLLIINKDQWSRFSYFPNTLKEIGALVSGLRREPYDVTVDLSGILRSGLITWAARSPYKLGFRESNEGSPLFYTHKIQGGTEIHAIDRYLKIAEAIGCDISEIRYPLAPYDPDPPICRELPAEYVVMSPSAGKEANRWPAERFGELSGRLALPTVVIGGAGDAGIVEQMVALSGGKAISLAGRTNLKELLAVIRRARFLVSNDTGPSHIAAALAVPVFAIFGPANPVRTGPYGSIHTVIREAMDCAPCYRWKPCSHWRCMEALTVDRVYETIMKKISE